MTAAASCAWLAILAVPWMACVATATLTASAGRTATGAVGLIWCIAAAALMALVEAPVPIVGGTWFVLPSSPDDVAMAFSWTIAPFLLWGIAVSGIALWWLAGSMDSDGSCAPWVLVQLVAGIAAQVWFLDNAWLLLVGQMALTGLCALLMGWNADGPTGGVAVRSLWMSGAWADGMQMLAIFGAAVGLASWQMSDFADAGRISELQSALPGVVPLVGLLWGIAVCGRLFQFPFSAVRDLAETGSSLANGMVWGVALLPLAVRWTVTGASWWSTTEVVADLGDGWSAIAALAAVWCALASEDLRVRVAWLLGAQGCLAIPALLDEPAAEASPLVVEQWSASLAASAWLFSVLRPVNRHERPGLTATALIWAAALSLCGIIFWPATFPADSTPDWPQLVRFAAIGLSGLATVHLAADAAVERLSVRAMWGSAWLVILPLTAAVAAGRFGERLMVELGSTCAILGWTAAALGIVAGLAWRSCPAGWQQKLGVVLNSLVRIGRQRFSVPKMILYGVNLPVRGAAQLCRFLDWFVIDAWLLGTLRRLQRPSGVEAELQTAGAEFYALALGLTAAAITLTVMWLAQ